MLGLVSRPTRDIDVVAMAQSDGTRVQVMSVGSLPAHVAEAVEAVSTQFGVEVDWLNYGPASLIDWGLPEGFESRLVAKRYGEFLLIHYAGRLDQVCFKTYAAADVAGRHLTDLIALTPSASDMDFAFRWAVVQDPSAAFRSQLEGLADYMEVRDVLDRVPR